MLGFTLSKLNMLILVTAIFVIITFFLSSLTGVVVGNQAQQLVSSYIEKVSTVVLSDSLCFKSSATVPDFLTYFGGASQGEKNFPYILKISKIESPDAQGTSTLILSVANRQFHDKYLAAKKIDVSAKIKLYSWNTETGEMLDNEEGKELSSTIIDAQAFPPVNSFVIIKEVFNSQKILHVIPCASQGASTAIGQSICQSNTERIGCILLKERGSASSCVPKSEVC